MPPKRRGWRKDQAQEAEVNGVVKLPRDEYRRVAYLRESIGRHCILPLELTLVGNSGDIFRTFRWSQSGRCMSKPGRDADETVVAEVRILCCTR